MNIKLRFEIISQIFFLLSFKENTKIIEIHKSYVITKENN